MRAIFIIHRNRITNFFRRRGLLFQDADDFCQEVMKKVWSAIFNDQAWASEQHLTSWLFECANNLRISAHRPLRARLTHISLHNKYSPEGISLEEKYFFEDSHESEIVDRIDLEKLKQCLVKLKAVDQEIIVLRYTEGFSIAEIGKLFSRPDGYINNRLHRALAKLERMCLAMGLSPFPNGNGRKSYE